MISRLGGSHERRADEARLPLLTESVGVALDGDDVGVVDEAVSGVRIVKGFGAERREVRGLQRLDLGGGQRGDLRRAERREPAAQDAATSTSELLHFGASGRQVETVDRTGVEMEALTAVQVALLTIYDMCKAVDRGMVIDGVHVVEKHGGKSGSFRAAPGP